MADDLPSIQEVGGASWPHDWLSYQTYVAVHDRCMEILYNEGLVIDGGFDFLEYGQPMQGVRIRGRIRCKFGLTIEIDKQLEVDSSTRVRGFDYSYHAWIEETGQPILRYDSAHGLPDLHRHEFNLTTGQETRTPITLDGLPTLDGFIRQAVALAERIADA